MKIFLTIIFLLVCIGLTAIVLMQEGKSAGLGSIGGIGDSYWGKNKSRSMEGNLVKFTKILATAFLLIALLLNVIPDASSSSSTTPAAAVETEAVTETQAATSETQAASEAGKAQAESETAKTQAVTEVGGASETEKK